MIALDDNIEDHPKFVGLSNDAFSLWVRGIGYCRRNTTNGFIPEIVAIQRARCTDPKTAINELTAEPLGSPGSPPLWEKVPGGYQIHDYLEWNPSKADVEAKLAAAREKGRKGGMRSAESRAKQPPAPGQNEASGLPPGSTQSNQEPTKVQAGCLPSGSTKPEAASLHSASTKSNPDPIRSDPIRSDISPETQSPLEPPKAPEDGGGEIGGELIRCLKRHRLTAHAANDPIVVASLVDRIVSSGLPLDRIEPGVDYAVDKLDTESATVGGGFPLNLETTVERIKSGLRGELTKWRNGPRVGATRAPRDQRTQPTPDVFGDDGGYRQS